MSQKLTKSMNRIIQLKDTVKALRKQLMTLQRENNRLQKEIADWEKCWKSYADNEWKKRLGF